MTLQAYTDATMDTARLWVQTTTSSLRTPEPVATGRDSTTTKAALVFKRVTKWTSLAVSLANQL